MIKTTYEKRTVDELHEKIYKGGKNPRLSVENKIFGRVFFRFKHFAPKDIEKYGEEEFIVEL